MIRFVALAFGITWILVTPLVLSEWGVLPAVPEWWHGLGALGPILAAHFSVRERGVFTRAGPTRMSRGWMIVCLATPAVFVAVSILVVRFQGEPALAPLIEAAGEPDWLISLAVGSILYGFGEEPGWRGWLQPHLQKKHSPFVATLILAPIWAVWHAPFFVYRFEFEGVVTIVGFFIGLLAGAFWLAFLYNATRSVMIVAVWHLMWNVANIALAAVSNTAVGVLNGLMMALGFAIAVMLALADRRPSGALARLMRNP